MDLRGTADRMRFDSRMVDWNIQNGKITPQELKAHLEQLQDLQSICEPLRVDGQENSEDLGESAVAADTPSVTQDPSSSSSDGMGY